MTGIIGKIIALSALFSTTAIAGTMGTISTDSWVAQLSLGPTWAHAGRSQTFDLSPEIEKAYIAHKKTKSLFNGEIFIGGQRQFNAAIKGQLGLALAATSNAKLRGVIWDDADPLFENYAYRYKINHTGIMAKAALILDRGWYLNPFVSASAGVGFNRAHGFNNFPLIFEAVPNSNFRNKTRTGFSYTLAAGVQKSWCTNWQAGVRYEFADWGRSILGRAPEQTLNSGLRLNHLYTNGVIFHLSYIT
mgnify:CR=1 FL=1